MDLVVRLANLPTDLPEIHAIRYAVFQIEQGVAPELEFDGKDDQADHFLAFLDGKPVGTVRLRFLDRQTFKLERLAVLSEVRNQGIGNALLQKALAYLGDRAVTAVQIHAQVAVETFYLKRGFVPEGPVFEEAGIPHVKMRKWLGTQG